MTKRYSATKREPLKTKRQASKEVRRLTRDEQRCVEAALRRGAEHLYTCKPKT